MQKTELLYVFRKRNLSNYSIERIYNEISKHLKNDSSFPFNLRRYTLKQQFYLKGFLFHFFKSLVSARKVVHITGACNHMVMAFPFQTRVFTLHDLIRYKKIKGIKGFLYDLCFVRLPVKFSHHIIVVSNNTRNELIFHFPKNKNKITVINNPLIVPEKIFKRNRGEITKGRPLKILQIGQKKNKNFERLIVATKSLNVVYTFIHSKSEIITELCHEYQIMNRAVILNNISEEELYKEYSTHDVLYFASEAEGFGLPIIEAQAHELPVITSSIAPMNSIGKGAILVDPLSVDEITKGFLKLFDQEVYNQVVKDGIINSKKYHVNDTIQEYSSFYKGLFK